MTLRAIPWLLSVLGASLAFVLANDIGTLALLVVTVAVPLASGCLLIAQARKLALSLELPETCAIGDNAAGLIVAEAAPLLPCAYVTATVARENPLAATCDTDVVTFSPHRNAPTCPFVISSQAPGRVAVRLDSCTATDLLGVFKRTVPAPDPATISFMPELFDMQATISPQADCNFENERYSMELAGNDPTETFALREYRPGDMMRSIHWKLSEKVGDLVVRELGLPIMRDILIVFENRLVEPHALPQPQVVHALVATFLSLSRSLALAGAHHTLCWQDDADDAAFREVTTQNDWKEAADALLGAQMRSAGKATPTRILEALGSCPYAHVVNVTCYLQPDLFVLDNGSNLVSALSFAPANAANAAQQVIATDFATYREDLRRLEI